VASAKRLRVGVKIQIQGDAIAMDLLLTRDAYKMRALRMLGQIDKAKEIVKNAAALMVRLTHSRCPRPKFQTWRPKAQPV